ALRYALARLSHRCSSAGYDEPAILSYAISSFCPTSADGLHGQACYRIVQDCVDLEELLLAAGTLAPGDRDDHGKVEAALSRFLSLCIADHRNAFQSDEEIRANVRTGLRLSALRKVSDGQPKRVRK